jgi:F-type H+-transporting ATPase subunit delta
VLSKSVARRYAAAFFEIARDNKQLGEMEAQLQNLFDIINDNRELKRVFYHRLIKESDKKSVVKDIFSSRISPVLLNFIYLLIDKKREVYLEQIKLQYIDMANVARNILDVSVTSAIELSAKDIKGLQDRLAELTGKNIRLKTVVDPKIIGGLVIRVGDRIIDGSITKRLQMLKNNLNKAKLRIS